MRAAIYTDYVYHEQDGKVFGERAFALFLAELAEHLDGAVVVGRLDPAGETSRYPIGDRIEFQPLPYYGRLDRLGPVARALTGAARAFWRSMDNVDGVWVLGPNPFAILFALLALLRRERVILGVRSEMLPYVRSRHPDSRPLQLAARILAGVFKILARRSRVVAVGPEIGAQYEGSLAVLEILVSLVDASDIAPLGEPRELESKSKLQVLSVGRIEPEKNPLLLADALAGLLSHDQRWRMIVCGEGPMEGQLRDRLADHGVEGEAELRGYVPLNGGLRELYAESDVLLHASWTEGFPQVLLEAFAAGIPVVATDVGGIGRAAGDAVCLIPPGDPEAATRAVAEVAADPELRRRIVERGREFVLAHTTEAETRRVAEFISKPGIS